MPLAFAHAKPSARHAFHTTHVCLPAPAQVSPPLAKPALRPQIVDSVDPASRSPPSRQGLTAAGLHRPATLLLVQL